MIVRLKSMTPECAGLSENQSYFVIGIEADDFRLLNDEGQPYLYPRVLFDISDARQPADWVTEFGEDGEQYAYPASLNEVGFFEDFFDHRREQTSIFWHVLNQTLAKAA